MMMMFGCNSIRKLFLNGKSFRVRGQEWKLVLHNDFLLPYTSQDRTVHPPCNNCSVLFVIVVWRDDRTNIIATHIRIEPDMTIIRIRISLNSWMWCWWVVWCCPSRRMGGQQMGIKMENVRLSISCLQHFSTRNSRERCFYIWQGCGPSGCFLFQLETI